MGGTVRTEVLWLPAGPRLSGLRPVSYQASCPPVLVLAVSSAFSAVHFASRPDAETETAMPAGAAAYTAACDSGRAGSLSPTVPLRPTVSSSTART